MLERLIAKERTARRLAELSDQKLTSYINRQKKFLGILSFASFAGDAGFAGSAIACLIAIASHNKSMFIAANAIGGLNLSIIYGAIHAEKNKQKAVEMAKNEALVRGLEVE